jgi:hypothetical protein
MYQAWVGAARAGLVLACLAGVATCRSPRPEGAASQEPGSGPEEHPARPHETSGSATGRSPAAADSTGIEEISYRLTGGIAGFDLTLELAAGGSAVVSEAGRPVRRGQLSTPEWQEVRGLVGAARVAELKPRYGQAGAVVDALHEVVTVSSGTRTIAVVVDSDPRDEPPEGFRALALRLREIALTWPAP